jgi:hypothetical protein
MLKEWVAEMCLIAKRWQWREDDNEEEWIEKQNNMETSLKTLLMRTMIHPQWMKRFFALAAQGGPIEVGQGSRFILQPSLYA